MQQVPGVRGARSADGRSGMRRALVAAGLAAALLVAVSAVVRAADCPPARELRLPPIEQPASNIDRHKKQLLAYHASTYADDLALVVADARAYVERRADEARWPAVVLDIDETSLSNWENTQDNDFGNIPNGPCPQQPGMACGFNDWVLKAQAPAIGPTLAFFNAMRAKNIAVFFITGRRDRVRDATLLNLDHAGYRGWAGLATRPDSDPTTSVSPFKTGERVKIAALGYTILANVGDQDSDLAGGVAECAFKLPNPFYFIK